MQYLAGKQSRKKLPNEEEILKFIPVNLQHEVINLINRAYEEGRSSKEKELYEKYGLHIEKQQNKAYSD